MTTAPVPAPRAALRRQGCAGHGSSNVAELLITAETVWVFVCDGAKAKAFEKSLQGEALQLVREAESAQARQFSRELGRDRPARGRTIGTGERFAIDRPSLHDEAERDFLKRCADHLNAQGEQNAYRRLILAADPHALGVLRPLLGPAVTQRLHLVIDKDLTNLPTDKLAEAIEKATP